MLKKSGLVLSTPRTTMMSTTTNNKYNCPPIVQRADQQLFRNRQDSGGVHYINKANIVGWVKGTGSKSKMTSSKLYTHIRPIVKVPNYVKNKPFSNDKKLMMSTTPARFTLYDRYAPLQKVIIINNTIPYLRHQMLLKKTFFSQKKPKMRTLQI